MLTIGFGENRLLPAALCGAVGRALSTGDDTLYIIVPKQLTLLTERLLLSELELSGSFRLRVLSPARLCTAVFEAAGFPEGTRIDDRGRVMLVRRAVRESEDLSIYRDACSRRGFGAKCAKQLEAMRQYGITPDALRRCADESTGSSRLRLNDLAAIAETYERLGAGLFLDGETELRLATERLGDVDFLSGARLFFFGFDLIPPTLIDLFAGLSVRAAEALFLCPARRAARAEDVDAPVRKCADRLIAAAKALGVATVCADADAIPETRDPALKHLADSLFNYPQTPFEAPSEAVTLVRAKDLREECLMAAATARKLAAGGMRYGDMQIVCGSLGEARQALIDAFALFEVPLFLNNSRAISRMAIADALLGALRLIAANYRREDVEAFLRTGMSGMNRGEIDRFTDYCVENNIEGTRYLRTFTRGRDGVTERMEPLRQRFVEPVERLRARLKAAKDLQGQLKALFDFLEDIRAYERCLRDIEALVKQDMAEAAGTLSQAWNRIMGAMDQMAALMGEKKLSLRELHDTLSESLNAALVKPLPQSGDAVFAQGGAQLLMQPARVVFLIGLNDRAAPSDDMLLSEGQNELIARHAGVHPGPTATERVQLRRFYMRAALGMAKERAYLSYALETGGGAAAVGAEIAEAQRLLPWLKPVPDEVAKLTMSNAPAPAVARAARCLAEKRDKKIADPVDEAVLNTLCERVVKEREDVAGKLRVFAEDREDDGRIDPSLAEQLYRGLELTSVSALEGYARCPFRYYMQHGLKPVIVKQPALESKDEGSICHEAINDFLRRCGDRLGDMTREEAECEMDASVDLVLSDAERLQLWEDSAVAAAERGHLRRVARSCAAAMSEHMAGSAFRLSGTERSFGPDDAPESRLSFGGTVLRGSIDRVDESETPGAVRIIDFKRGGKEIDVSAAYHGLRLQLPLYMAVALKGRDVRDAGFFYFPLSDGVVLDDSRDPKAIEDARSKAMRMVGILPMEEDLLEAHAPDIPAVFHAKRTANGWDKYTRITDAKGFERLLNHAEKTAEKYITEIRSGKADVSPSVHGTSESCTYCDYRAACLFDREADAPKLRRLRKLSWDQVFEKLAEEEDEVE